jgi:hypothetical protein
MADNRQFSPGAGSDPSLRMREISSDLMMMLVLAGEHVRVYDGVESLTVGSGVSSLTVPSGATHAEIYLETATAGGAVRYWHGTNPSVSVGIRLYDNEQIGSAQPSQFRVTNGGATGPTLRVNYYHYA